MRRALTHSACSTPGRNSMTARKPPAAGIGRKKGVPNKATADVRAAIARFAEGNVEKLQSWLERVAKKDPARAADIYLRVLEYHVPRLARTEHTGEIGVRGKLVIEG
jgi:hypothetical protein